MLKDPDFNISEKTLEFMSKGVFFDHRLVECPFGKRKIPWTVGISDPNFKSWALPKHLTIKPAMMFAVAKHGTGIYHGYSFEIFVDNYSNSNLVAGVGSISTSTGEYYTYQEQAEAYKSILDDKDKTTGDLLSNGKVISSFGSMATPYGIADNITQVLKHFRKAIMREDYDVALSIQVLKKHNGMRWHKEGQYLGTFKKKHEYLSDEVGLGDLISFHLHVYEKEK